MKSVQHLYLCNNKVEGSTNKLGYEMIPVLDPDSDLLYFPCIQSVVHQHKHLLLLPSLCFLIYVQLFKNLACICSADVLWSLLCRHKPLQKPAHLLRGDR